MAKILFNKIKIKSRMVYTVEDLHTLNEPPLSLIQKAEARFLDLKNHGMIKDFKVFKEKFKELWLAQKSAFALEKDTKKELSFDIIIATGIAPALVTKNKNTTKTIPVDPNDKDTVKVPYLETQGVDQHDDEPSNHSGLGDLQEFRASQQKKLARRGHVVAVLKYKKIPKEKLSPDTPMNVLLGDGIKESPKGVYIATFDGRPVVEGLTLRLERDYVHEGDVNLSSGDIFIAGNLEIKGSIEHGTRVRAGGNITVGGSILGGQVHAGGNLTVAGGINGQKDSRIHCHGELKAGFVQNAHISAIGNIVVERAIIASHIVCQNKIILASGDGAVFGGVIRVYQSLECATLGKTEGAFTDLKVGVHSKYEIRHLNLKLRKNLVQKIKEQSEHNLNTINHKSDAQLAKKHIELKSTLKNAIKRCDHLLDKITLAMEKSKGHLMCNLEASINIRGKVSSNCEIYLCDKKVPLPQDLLGLSIKASSYDPDAQQKKAS